MKKHQNIADLVQEAIDQGADTVEEVHKAIANLPLEVLEEIKFLEKPAGEMKRLQDLSIGAIYDLIRNINDHIGKLASGMLDAARKEEPHEKPHERRARAS
jgi:hypothetical protein